MKNVINSGKVLAVISFIIGTTILLFHLVFSNHFKILIIGFYYTIGATVINLCACLTILLYAIANKTYRIKLLKSCAFMLINIPITILYVFIVFWEP